MGKEDEWWIDEGLERWLYHVESKVTEKNNEILSQDATAGKNSIDTKDMNHFIESILLINTFLRDNKMYSNKSSNLQRYSVRPMFITLIWSQCVLMLWDSKSNDWRKLSFEI
jgi:hypothetical protein